MFAQGVQTAIQTGTQALQTEILAPLEAQMQSQTAAVQKVFPSASPGQAVAIVFAAAVGFQLLTRKVAGRVERGLDALSDRVPWGAKRKMTRAPSRPRRKR